MQVSSKVFKPQLRKIDKDAILALIKTADELKTDLQQSQTMPFKTGQLQNRSTYVDDSNASKGSVRVVSDTPYARRLYYHPEYNFSKSGNPNASGMWFEPYIDGNKKNFVRKAFAKHMEKKL